MKKHVRFLLALAASAALVVGSTPQAFAAGRDYISIVGSSTVYPFATVVAEQFGKTTKFKTPKIESTGSGGGLKLFCEGVGVQHPDITNASRRIKKSEFETCQKNGVKEIVEERIGYDGIVVANSKASKQINLSQKDLFLALAKTIPSGKGDEMIANNNKTWKDVNPALPDIKIEVLGPPPTSGTRDAFVELVMDEGCQEFPAIKALKKSDKKMFKSICQAIREDGAYIEAGENDVLIVRKLEANKNAFGIFGFSFLDQNADKIQGSLVDGVEPTFDTIASGKYPVSRPLFFYVKKAHVGTIPGIQEYVNGFMSAKAIGSGGYLNDKGLIPMPQPELEKYQKIGKDMIPLSMGDL